MTTHPLVHHILSRFKHRKEFVFAHKEHKNVDRHPDPIFLHYGYPHDGFFPVDSMELTVVDEPFESYNNPDKELRKVVIPRHRSRPEQLDLLESFNYSEDYGLNHFNRILKEYIEATHKPGFEDWDFVCSFGTGDGVYKVFDLLLDPGDSVLVEEYTFVISLSSITSFGAEIVPTKLDLYKDGIDVDSLEHLLENWSTLKPGKRFPKALLTIPSGHNPVGTTQTLETRKRVLALCEKYDIIIVEDDPYGYLALEKYGKPNPFTDSLEAKEFFDKYVPTSYIELDTTGRVIRMDSFSKILFPGLRIGAIVANKAFIEKIKLFVSILTKQPSGVSQAVFCTLYNNMNGMEGLGRWFIRLSHEYTERKKVFINHFYECRLYKLGKLHILEPSHGMFVVIQFNFKEGTNVQEALDEMEKIGLAEGIVFVLGTRLSATDECKKNANFVRLALSCSKNHNDLIVGAQRFIRVCDVYFENFEGLEKDW